MIIAKIVGNIVSTVKHKDYMNHKLFIVRAVDMQGNVTGSEIVALDGNETNAGIGDIVLIDQEGGGARQLSYVDHLGPIEAVVAGVVDYVETSSGSFTQF